MLKQGSDEFKQRKEQLGRSAELTGRTWELVLNSMDSRWDHSLHSDFLCRCWYQINIFKDSSYTFLQIFCAKIFSDMAETPGDTKKSATDSDAWRAFRIFHMWKINCRSTKLSSSNWMIFRKGFWKLLLFKKMLRKILINLVMKAMLLVRRSRDFTRRSAKLAQRSADITRGSAELMKRSAKLVRCLV